jgi:hypothetical protein
MILDILSHSSRYALLHKRQALVGACQTPSRAEESWLGWTGLHTLYEPAGNPYQEMPQLPSATAPL